MCRCVRVAPALVCALPKYNLCEPEHRRILDVDRYHRHAPHQASVAESAPSGASRLQHCNGSFVMSDDVTCRVVHAGLAWRWEACLGKRLLASGSERTRVEALARCFGHFVEHG